MPNPTFVTPQAGSGGVTVRLAPQIDPATKLGLLNESARLELDAPGAEWHSAKVYVAMSVAETIDQHIKPKGNWETINIRSAPRTDPSTDVGDLAQAQRLELISTIEDWFIARVYVSAQFTDLVNPIEPVKPDEPLAVPHGSPLTLAELQVLSLTPAQRRSAPSSAPQAAFTAARIWNKYGGVLEPLANKIGLDPGAAVAVVAIESGGSGFGADGRMIIRFENHLFWFNWGKAHADTFIISSSSIKP